MADVIYSNVPDLMRRLKAIEPTLVRQLQSEAKKPAKKLQAEIVNAIPSTSPFAGRRKDGFTHNGRTSWNNSVNYKKKRVPAKSVSINFKSSRSKQANVTSLVKIQVNAPSVAIADTAQRARTPQGAAFVTALNYAFGSKPSRIVWKAAEKSLPAVQAEVRIVLDRFAVEASRRLF